MPPHQRKGGRGGRPSRAAVRSGVGAGRPPCVKSEDQRQPGTVAASVLRFLGAAPQSCLSGRPRCVVRIKIINESKIGKPATRPRMDRL
jgi:hypothetical protein